MASPDTTFKTYECKGAVLIELQDGVPSHGRILLTEAIETFNEEITLMIDANNLPTGCPYASMKTAKDGCLEVDDSKILNHCRARDFIPAPDGSPATYETLTDHFRELHKDNPRFQELLKIAKTFGLRITYSWAWCGEGSWMKQAVESTSLDPDNPVSQQIKHGM